MPVLQRCPAHTVLMETDDICWICLADARFGDAYMGLTSEQLTTSEWRELDRLMKKAYAKRGR